MILPRHLKNSVVAVGGDVKCVPALGRGNTVEFQEALGDVGDPAVQDVLSATLGAMISQMGEDGIVACDAHPGYLSTRIAHEVAARYRMRLTMIQHHRAHVAAVLAEHGIEQDVVGLAFDGTGYGDDGVVWGGEFFTGLSLIHI